MPFASEAAFKTIATIRWSILHNPQTRLLCSMNCAMLSLESFFVSNSSCFISIIAPLEKIFVSFPSPLVLTPIFPLQPKGIKGKWFSYGAWKAGWLSLWPQSLLISCLEEQLEIINWASPGLSGSIERWAKEDRQKDNILIKIWALSGKTRM